MFFVDATEEPEDEERQFLLDKQLTLKKAMKAATEGNAVEASFLFRLHARMIRPIPVKAVIAERPTKIVIDVTGEESITQNVTEEGSEEPFVENGVTFMPGHVPSSTTSLLTPYFDKNIKEF